MKSKESLAFSAVALFSLPRELYPYGDDIYLKFIKQSINITLIRRKIRVSYRFLVFLERLIGWSLLILFINTLSRVMIRYWTRFRTIYAAPFSSAGSTGPRPFPLTTERSMGSLPLGHRTAQTRSLSASSSIRIEGEKPEGGPAASRYQAPHFPRPTESRAPRSAGGGDSVRREAAPKGDETPTRPLESRARNKGFWQAASSS